VIIVIFKQIVNIILVHLRKINESGYDVQSIQLEVSIDHVRGNTATLLTVSDMKARISVHLFIEQTSHLPHILFAEICF